MQHPVLYSFIRCPYAMRARLALLKQGMSFYLREVNLKDKPSNMLKISPKGTVPVILLSNNQVIDESLDIVNWAFALEKDYHENPKETEQISSFQNDFIHYVYRFKYPERYEDTDQATARAKLQAYLEDLIPMLVSRGGLYAGSFSKAEVVMLPFIRQAYIADESILAASKYKVVKSWLEDRLAAELFSKAMHKAQAWSVMDNNQVLITV